MKGVGKTIVFPLRKAASKASVGKPWVSKWGPGFPFDAPSVKITIFDIVTSYTALRFADQLARAPFAVLKVL